MAESLLTELGREVRTALRTTGKCTTAKRDWSLKPQPPESGYRVIKVLDSMINTVGAMRTTFDTQDKHEFINQGGLLLLQLLEILHPIGDECIDLEAAARLNIHRIATRTLHEVPVPGGHDAD